MIAVVPLLVTALVAAVADPVGSNPPAAEPMRNYVGANVGLATSVGEFGLTYDRDLSTYLQLQLGVGLGATGYQFATMPRYLRRTTPSSGYFFGAGPSLAIDQDQPHSRTVWGNFEAGYQYEISAFFLQAAIGYTLLIHGNVIVDCPWCSGNKGDLFEPGQGLPTFRLGLGMRF